MKQKFDNCGGCGCLTDPEKKHPLDDFGFHFCPVLFGHQSFCEILFLFVKSEFQAFGNSSGFLGLNIRGFQNTKNLCGAHGKKFSKCLSPFVAFVHSNLLNRLPLSLFTPPFPARHTLFPFPSFDSLAPARSPFGPTYGCSISCLPRHSIVVNPSCFHFQLN